jgi:PEP-CTERM motif
MTSFFNRSVLALAAAVSFVGAASAADFVNGDFSAGPNGWSNFGGSGTGFEISGGVGHVYGTATDTNNSGSFAGRLTQTLSGLTAGNAYTVSFSAKGTGFMDLTDSLDGSVTNNVAGGGFDLNEAGTLTGDTNPADSELANNFAGWSAWMVRDEVFRIVSPSTSTSSFQTYSFSFYAPTDGQVTLWVKSQETLTNESAGPLTGGLYVDNFSLTEASAVPEPETYAMMLAGLGAMGLISRRRRAQ